MARRGLTAGVGLLVLAIGCAVAQASSSPAVVLVDSRSGAYLQPGAPASIEQHSLAPLLAAFSGLLPGQAIDEALSNQLEGIVKPSALRKPKALVVLNVAGLSTEAVGHIFKGRQQRTVELTGKGCPSSAVVSAVARLSAANPGVKLSVVDQAGLQSCEGDCIAQNLAAAGEVCNAKVSDGSLLFGSGDSLNLKRSEDRMFGIELASMFAGVKAELAALAQRAELVVAQDDVELYEVSFMGLHSLASTYGADSAVVKAARAALVDVLEWAAAGLDAAYGGDIAYQVSVLSQPPHEAETVGKLAAWKERTRRQLLATPTVSDDEAAQIAQAKKFSRNAAAYAAFIIVLYFSMAAVWCMCYMPFKHDTLLYGSKKAE